MSRTTSSKTKEQAESCLGRVPAKPEKCFVWPQDDLQLEKLEATEAAIRRAVGSWTIVRKVLVSDDNDLDSWIINLSLEQAEKVRELKCNVEVMEDGPAGAELAWLSVHKRYSCQGSPKLECLIWPRQYIEPEEISVMDDAIRKIIGASTTVKKQMVNDNKELAFWLAYLSLRQVEDIEKLDGVVQVEENGPDDISLC